MKIIVCIKQVPDAKDVRLDPHTNTLAREGVQSIMNPYDQYALEEAVRLKEKMWWGSDRDFHGSAPGGRGAPAGNKLWG